LREGGREKGYIERGRRRLKVEGEGGEGIERWGYIDGDLR